jgi:hypothetical protein
MQLRGSDIATIAAPARHVTTPILLPESDLAYWSTVIAIKPDGGPQATS